MEIITEEELNVLKKYVKLLENVKVTQLDLNTMVTEGKTARVMAQSKGGELVHRQNQAQKLENDEVKPILKKLQKEVIKNKRELFYPKSVAYMATPVLEEEKYTLLTEVLAEINNNKHLDLALRC